MLAHLGEHRHLKTAAFTRVSRMALFRLGQRYFFATDIAARATATRLSFIRLRVAALRPFWAMEYRDTT